MSRRGRKNKTFVKVQRLSKVPQEFDDSPAVWEDVYTDQRCSIKPVRADERNESQQVQEVVTHTVDMRHRPDITSDCRLVVDDVGIPEAQKRKLHIHGIINYNDQDRYLTLMCREVDTESFQTLDDWTWEDGTNHEWSDGSNATFTPSATFRNRRDDRFS